MKIQGNILHEERIHFYLVSLIFIPLIFIFSAILLYQIFVAPVGSRPAPNWVYIIFILVFAVFFFGFRTYNLLLTSDCLVAGFPMYKKRISWDEVVDVERDTTPVWKYGDYGIRVAGKNARRVLALTVPGTARIKIKLRGSKWNYMVLSTKNANLVQSHILLKIGNKN